MTKLIYLMIGGISGTFARYFLSGVTYKVTGQDFPYGTLAVNVLGCFVMGLLSSLASKKFLIGEDLKLLLMIGFCGAFTTFSTFMLETCNLMKDGENLRAFFNVAASVVFGFLAFRLGVFLAEIF